jgi:hypothetical protein
MDQKQWSALAARIGPHEADDLDPLLAPLDDRPAQPGRDLFPLPEAPLMPGVALARPDAVAVGLRAADSAADRAQAADRATRITAFGVERDVEIVVLSRGDISGFERFGFRVERIAGDSAEARAACEDQIRRFWNIDLIL